MSKKAKKKRTSSPYHVVTMATPRTSSPSLPPHPSEPTWPKAVVGSVEIPRSPCDYPFGPYVITCGDSHFGFWKGLGSVLDVGGDSFLNLADELVSNVNFQRYTFKTDADALASDWRRVLDDLTVAAANAKAGGGDQ